MSVALVFDFAKKLAIVFVFAMMDTSWEKQFPIIYPLEEVKMALKNCKACGRLIGTGAKKCPICGEPVIMSRVVGCLTITAILFVIGFFGLVTIAPLKKSCAPTNLVSSGPDEIGAFVMSQRFVEKGLKAPSTAHFCSYSGATVTDLGGGRFRVSAYVDAENSFGAKIRTNYTCVLKSTDGDTWTLESLHM
jgi:hypothetical protein